MVEVFQLAASHLAKRETMEAEAVRSAKLTLADILEQPIKSFHVEEVYGRVCLIRYKLYKRADPVLPIVVGWHSCSFRAAFKKMSMHLESWNFEVNQTTWYQTGKQIASLFLASLCDVIDHDEYIFIKHHLHHALADPRAYQ